jgi:hypothetical protein
LLGYHSWAEYFQSNAAQKKAPPFGGAFLIYSPFRLTILTGGLLSLAVGILALTARVLLLLAGLLAAALLLTRLLSRALALLTRIVLVGHRSFSVV